MRAQAGSCFSKPLQNYYLFPNYANVCMDFCEKESILLQKAYFFAFFYEKIWQFQKFGVPL